MDTNTTTIDLLMHQVQAGEKLALDGLYEAMSPGLFACLRRMGCNPDDAADLLQTTFLKVWQFRQQYRGQQAKAWIYKIALNSWRDFYTGSPHWQETVYEESTDYREDRQTCPETVLNAERLAASLQEALMRLPVVLREAVVLSRFSGLGIREMAALLGTTESNIKVRIHRGLVLLKQSLVDSETTYPVRSGDKHD